MTITEKRTQKLSKEILLNELRVLHAKYPEDSASAIIKRSGHGFSPFSRYIGPMQVINDLLGLSNNNHTPKNQEKSMITDIRKIAAEHPEEKTPYSLISKYGKFTYSGCFRRIGKERIYEIVEEARKKNMLVIRFYPIKYMPAPVIIKWARKRIG